MSKLDKLKGYGSNTFWLLLDRFSQNFLAFAVGVFIARNLGTSGYGELNFAISYGLLFAAFSVLGTDQVAVKELVERPCDEGVILGSCMLLRSCGFILQFLLVMGSAWLCNFDSTTIIMLLFIMVGYLGVILNGIDAFFQARILLKYTAISTVVNAVVFASFNLWGCYMRYGLYYFAFTNGAIVLSSGIFKNVIYRRLFKKQIKWQISLTEMMNLLRMSGWIFFYLLLNAFAMNAGYLVLRFAGSEAMTGIYSVVVKILACAILIPEVISTSFFPLVIAARGTPKFRLNLDLLYFSSFYFGILAVIASFWLGEFGIVLLFGENFREAGELLWIGMSGLPFAGIAVVLLRWSILENRQFAMFIFSAGQLVGTTVIMYFLLKAYGITGAVAGVPALYLTGLLGMIFCGGRKTFHELIRIFMALTVTPWKVLLRYHNVKSFLNNH